ncbi:MAG: T9SS type A sorting domain-containing protein [Bacteroidia bacterium]
MLRLEAKELEEGKNNIAMDLSDLSAGLYLLQVTTAETKVVRRFVVAH